MKNTIFSKMDSSKCQPFFTNVKIGNSVYDLIPRISKKNFSVTIKEK